MVEGPNYISSILAEVAVNKARWEVGNLASNAVTTQPCVVTYRDKGPVLVDSILVVKEVEKIIPSRLSVRFEGNDEGKELWGNLVGESVFYGFLKPSSRFRKGKLNRAFPPNARSNGRDDLPVSVVERRSKVIEDIAGDNGRFFYSGYVLLGVGGSPVGLGVCFQDISEGLFLAETLTKLVDVFRGPLNLEVG